MRGLKLLAGVGSLRRLSKQLLLRRALNRRLYSNVKTYSPEHPKPQSVRLHLVPNRNGENF